MYNRFPFKIKYDVARGYLTGENGWVTYCTYCRHVNEIDFTANSWLSSINFFFFSFLNFDRNENWMYLWTSLTKVLLLEIWKPMPGRLVILHLEDLSSSVLSRTPKTLDFTVSLCLYRVFDIMLIVVKWNWQLEFKSWGRLLVLCIGKL